ncbi:MAG TPA: enoyl-CoA hydratase/isomerase family protein [Chloroflexota bacterium]|jgi:2-(1,2-epoxy-1,2-dihydrophenyl)acetyl-CoA isomerase
MAYELVLFERAEGVARITLNRPERLNALNVGMGLELADALEECEHDDAVRVIVLTGAGRGFCAGDDLKELTDPTSAPGARRRRSDPMRQYVDGPGRWPAIVRTMTRLPKPIVGAINGHAHGAGFNLALACDFRVLSQAATLALPFVKWGMATGTNRLQQFVGLGKALEWALLGTTLSADEAERWGLATVVAPPERFAAATDELVGRLAAAPTAALGFTKLAVLRGWERDPDGAYELQGLAQHFTRQTEDLAEGLRAFAEKRSARFSGKLPPDLRSEA